MESNVELFGLTDFEMELIVGDIEGDEFQKLDAGLSKASLMNEVGEHVKEGIENDLGIAQVVAKQHSDHGQRMADELLKSTHPPVSDGNTCVNEGPKEKGIRPINQVFVDHEDIDEAGDIEYSNVWARTGKSVDDSEMSGSNPGAFDAPIDVPAANSDPNYLMQARSNVNPDVEHTKFSVESEIVSEQNVTADQCPISADSVLRKGTHILHLNVNFFLFIGSPSIFSSMIYLKMRADYLTFLLISSQTIWNHLG